MTIQTALSRSTKTVPGQTTVDVLDLIWYEYEVTQSEDRTYQDLFLGCVCGPWLWNCVHKKKQLILISSENVWKCQFCLTFGKEFHQKTTPQIWWCNFLIEIESVSHPCILSTGLSHGINPETGVIGSEPLLQQTPFRVWSIVCNNKTITCRTRTD
jgi:hypothetical protein